MNFVYFSLVFSSQLIGPNGNPDLNPSSPCSSVRERMIPVQCGRVIKTKKRKKVGLWSHS
ncbi:hypothetical protein BDV38DRAFT_249799, partial [Aspergillus pseudotamarii]